MMCGRNKTNKSEFSNITFSALLNPSSILQILNNHNDMLTDIEKFEQGMKEKRIEVEELKMDLEKQLVQEQPNIIEITDRKVK